MSNYYRPAYHPPTQTVRNALWADDYFGRHQYAVLFEGDETAYKPEQVAIPAGKVFVSLELLRESEYSLSQMEDAYLGEKERARRLASALNFIRKETLAPDDRLYLHDIANNALKEPTNES